MSAQRLLPPCCALLLLLGLLALALATGGAEAQNCAHCQRVVTRFWNSLQQEDSDSVSKWRTQFNTFYQCPSCKGYETLSEPSSIPYTDEKFCPEYKMCQQLYTEYFTWLEEDRRTLEDQQKHIDTFAYYKCPMCGFPNLEQDPTRAPELRQFWTEETVDPRVYWMGRTPLLDAHGG